MTKLSSIAKQISDINDDDSCSDSESELDDNPISFSNVSYYKGTSKDPYLIDGPDSDEEDFQVHADDNLVVIGKVKDKSCSFEVYLHNEKENLCYCHQDVLLPNLPLSIEWLDFDPFERDTPGNFLAIGNMGPDIEVWDLDVVNSVEPTYVLKGINEPKNKAKKKKKMQAADGGHRDAVLALSWSRSYRHVLASASADHTIALWDLMPEVKNPSKGLDPSEIKVVTRFKLDSKVQCLQWQPGDNMWLLAGCADQTVNLFDCNSVEKINKWSVNGEVECVLWDTFREHYFYAGTDTGFLYCFDSRAKAPVFQLPAHAQAVSGVAQSSKLGNCLVTVSTDGTLKVWKTQEQDSRLAKVFSKKMNMGQLFDVAACPDSSLLFAVAGEERFQVLNLAKDATIMQCYGGDGGAATAVSGDIEVPIGYEEDIEEESEDDDVQRLKAGNTSILQTVYASTPTVTNSTQSNNDLCPIKDMNFHKCTKW